MNHFLAALVLGFTLLAPLTASACPNCKDTVGSGDVQETAGLPGGFNQSIYFMLGGVTVVAGLVLRMIVKEVRKSERLAQPVV